MAKILELVLKAHIKIGVTYQKIPATLLKFSNEMQTKKKEKKIQTRIIFGYDRKSSTFITFILKKTIKKKEKFRYAKLLGERGRLFQFLGQIEQYMSGNFYCSICSDL